MPTTWVIKFRDGLVLPVQIFSDARPGSTRWSATTPERSQHGLCEWEPSAAGNTLMGMSSSERLAVIDLGSNSFRLVVFSAADGWWQRTDEIYEPVRIGEGMGATGRLGEEPMRRALATLDVFAHFCQAAGLAGHAVDAVATSAIREAENAAEFLERRAGARASRSGCSAASRRRATATSPRSTRRR